MLENLITAMTDYYRGDPARIQHFIKVHTYCKTLGKLEQLPENLQEIVEIAGIVHDIGIKPAEEKYGSCAGPLQEKEGIEPAQKLLQKLGYSPEIVERVCFLVGHHHTLTCVDGLDYQILLEADFLVNAYEDSMKKEAIISVLNRVFVTNSGKKLLISMFDLEDIPLE